MAGSQLKNLKATLKAHGLTGQANVKKNMKNTKRQAKEYDREEKMRTLGKIREQFNPFEVKSNKNKKFDGRSRDSSTNRVAVGKPGISKQIGEDQRLKAYEVKKQFKNKKGGILDRRFGERDKNMTEEEKMLERFTRERQSHTKKQKQNIFDLENGSDGDDLENDLYGTTLTHLGNDIHMGEDDEFSSRKRSSSQYEEDTLGYNNEADSSIPQRKKTKAEVMQEVIAKSKYYKQERQKAQRSLEEKIDDVDEDFDDVMSELFSGDNDKFKPAKTDIKENEREYDMKVKELLLEKRAVPSDRTKTEEEIHNAAEEKKKQLEQQRLDRMNGMVINMGENDGDDSDNHEERGVEDLDDGFWNNSDEDELEGEEIMNSDDDIKFDDDDGETITDDKVGNEEEYGLRRRGETRVKKSVPCPTNHGELLTILEAKTLADHPSIIKSIIKNYQPKLAEGNKERLAKFTTILLRHIIFLAGEDYSNDSKEFQTCQDSLIHILKNLSEKYNNSLSMECREIVNEIQLKFKNGNFQNMSNSDLMFFIIVGIIYSTSDQYHIVATSSTILMCELLEQIKFNSYSRLAYGAILANILLQYQTLSKRFVPELVGFYEKSLSTLLGSFDKCDIRIDNKKICLKNDIAFNDNDSIVIKLHEIFDSNINSTSNFQKTLLLNLLKSLDNCISTIWKELPAFQEIIINIQILLDEFSSKFESLTIANQILGKVARLGKFAEHIPLTLQDHKPVSIPSNAPKFEENFNPDKKSYDPDRTRSEINKMKAQLKKERKFTMKEIRKDTRFEARQRIDEKKKQNEEYHSKMARIINTISTEEGAEKNKYEREKRLRSGKK